MAALEKGARLEGLESEELTGHTSFKDLSAEEKLLWLAHAAAFALEARRARAGDNPHLEVVDRMTATRDRGK